MKLAIELLIAPFITIALFLLLSIINDIIKYRKNIFSNPESQNSEEIKIEKPEQILAEKFSYYKNLSSSEKKRFTTRLINFINSKEFIPRQGLNLTDEIKVLIAASAIQLTFGLDEYLLDHFSRIIIYPGKYYSMIHNRYHKGEVNLRGAIILSWEDFKKGYNSTSDNYNLGLHEMAHALRFDRLMKEEFDKVFTPYFDKWSAIAKEEFLKLKNQESSFLREYGGDNINEFFSVCVEHFFESPNEFKKQLPEIYLHLCILLNQDPSQKEPMIASPVTKP